MAMIDQERRASRAETLGLLNGLRMILIDQLRPLATPSEADLEVHFYNANQVAAILAAAGTPQQARAIFPIFGGLRLPAGNSEGQVRVTNVVAGPTANTLVLTVSPIGDYSTYTLGVRFQNIDPLFNELGFRFRPGCFTTNCAPEWCPGDAIEPAPQIDYLARDFDSFKHTLISAMIERVPGWQPTSEADLNQTLIELLAAAGDELSDFQDRVMSEAYLGSARKRVSLARHARLMDYHIHQGNQARTWLALRLGPSQIGTVPAGLTAWTADDEGEISAASQVFMAKENFPVNPLFNSIRLYTWGGVIHGLEAGTTRADLLAGGGTAVEANALRDRILDGTFPRLLVQEWRDPLTCNPAGADPRKRQLLTLIAASAESIHDPDPTVPANPNLGTWAVRVRWREKLERAYCFLATCPDPTPGTFDDVALFHGNLVRVHHGVPRGIPIPIKFLPPDQPLQNPDEYHYELPPLDTCTCRDEDCHHKTGLSRRWGVICRLPDDERLAYTRTPSGGEIPPRSTLAVEVVIPAVSSNTWDEQPSLVFSDDSDEGGDHFVVETDEEGRSLIRFGDGENGIALPQGAEVHCTYQVGLGPDGNVGPDSIVGLNRAFDALLTGATVWNPFDVTDGHAPEVPEVIIRRVPEAYRARQLRAVALKDYVRRAEEVPGVARAAARYAWTGSWRTVQIAIDPIGTTDLEPALRAVVASYLESVRLIGEDLEIRPPRYVPLDIAIDLCIRTDFWPEDVRFVIEMELSDGFTRDGRKGFFHPDCWTFGQDLHASEIIGRVQAIPGVDHVIAVRMRRWDAVTAGTDAVVALRANEIILVENDPDHMERGFIRLTIGGGRQ